MQDDDDPLPASQGKELMPDFRENFIATITTTFKATTSYPPAGAHRAGGTTKYELAGNYTLRVVQQSGYVVTPTDRTYTGTLVCNGILTTTYP